MPSLHHVAVVGNSLESQPCASGACGHSKMICIESGGGGAVCLPSAMLSFCCALHFFLDLFQSFDVLLLLLSVEFILS